MVSRRSSFLLEPDAVDDPGEGVESGVGELDVAAAVGDDEAWPSRSGIEYGEPPPRMATARGARRGLVVLPEPGGPTRHMLRLVWVPAPPPYS